MDQTPFQIPAPTLDTRERLLRAAKTLMAQQGYEQTTTSALVREAGTSESQLVRHFGSKVGLLQALFESAWKSLNPRLRVLVKTAPDAFNAILEVFALFLDLLNTDTELAILLLFESRRLRKEEQVVWLSPGYRSFEKLLYILVRRCQQEGRLDPHLHPTALLAALMGAAEGMIRERLFHLHQGHEAKFDLSDIRRVFTRLLGQGAACEPALAIPPQHST